jgi:hypothetical protein
MKERFIADYVALALIVLAIAAVTYYCVTHGMKVMPY